MIYADAEYYTSEYGGKLDAEVLDFKSASRHIDTLTFNGAVSFDRLTEFQQRVIRESTCMLAEFEHDNADMIASAVSSYSLNGASVTYGNGGIGVVNGVYIRKDIYGYLNQSGLCCGVLK